MRVAMIVLSTVAYLSAAAATAQETPVNASAAIERVKKGIAPIVCIATDSETRRPTVRRILGSAFFVSASGAFLTANHVLDASTSVPGGCERAIYVPMGGWTRGTNQQVRFLRFISCRTDVELDIAHCHTETDMAIPSPQNAGVSILPLSLERSQHPDGTPIIFSGFPFESPQPLSSRGSISRYRTPDSAHGTLWIDKGAWGGLSGGPVYLEDGRVIGMIIQRTTDDAAGLAIARPAFYFGAVMTDERSGDSSSGKVQ